MGFFVVVPEERVGTMQKAHHGEAMAFLRWPAIAATSSEIVAAWKASRSR